MFAVVDIETTGLNAHADSILEVSMARVNHNLEIETLCQYVINQVVDPQKIDPYVWDMHTENGLWREVEGSPYGHDTVEQRLCRHYRDWFGEESLPMTGSSLRLDRHFLEHAMPDFHNFFHYRSIDVSTIKELARLYAPDVAETWDKSKPQVKAHRGPGDIHATVTELAFYLRRMSWL